jgi:hypothetical protein
MQTIENTPTTIHAVAYTDPTVTHYVKIEAGQYCITGQPGWLAADSEAELLQLCEANNVALPELPAEGEEIQEGLYSNPEPQAFSARTQSSSAVACRIAHVRESTDVRQDDRFITSTTGVPSWKAGEQIGEGAIRAYEGSNYRCVQSHTVQADWAPPLTPALWALEPPAGVEWPAWSQPTGAQDAYAFGQKVSHNGANWISQRRANVWEPGTFDAGWQEQIEEEPEWPLWQQPIPGLTGREPYSQGAQVTHLGEQYVSLQDANVWEPGVFGWELQQQGSNEWAVGVSYSVGDIVTYEGQQYECRQAHTSIAPWIPPNVPALWLLI